MKMVILSLNYSLNLSINAPMPCIAYHTIPNNILTIIKATST